MAAPLPHDETRRLRALRDLRILDTPPEAFTDAIASAAAALANTPMSAISLVDADRQWFKGSCGLKDTETPRDVSFCAHTLLQSRPLIVADTWKDERFRSNALVTGAPHIRFYAGISLIVRGQSVGALCVLDDRPRQLSDHQLRQLDQMASGVAAWLTRYKLGSHSA